MVVSGIPGMSGNEAHAQTVPFLQFFGGGYKGSAADEACYG